MAGNGNGSNGAGRPRGLLAPLMRLFGSGTGDANETSLQEDLEEVIVEHEGTDAAFSATQRDILSNLVEFGRLRTDDVMVPRADIIAIDIETPFDEALSVFKDAAHSRLPVYRATLDDPVGMIHIKDLMAVLADEPHGGGERAHPPLSQLKREVLCVPPSMPLAELLVRMQATRIHMALVIDEYGGTDGLLTIEDLVEEIVGDIEDEHDIDTSPRLIRVADGTYLADARLEIPEFEETSGLDLTPDDWDEDVDTLGGLVFALLGRVPQRGEVVRPTRGIEIQVVDADPRRVKRLRVCPLTKGADAEAQPGADGAEGAHDQGQAGQSGGGERG
jgi:CBS domain containing-hemolysin-like protein